MIKTGMLCPHCKKDIPEAVVAKHLGSKGGSTSKRTITIEQQAAMQSARIGKGQVSPKILAEFWRVSKTTVINSIKRGDLVAEMIKGKYQIRIQGAVEWYCRCYTGTDEREKMFMRVQMLSDLENIRRMNL